MADYEDLAKKIESKAIPLDWSPWHPWIAVEKDHIRPLHFPGVYEARFKGQAERLTIGKAADLHRMVKEGFVKGKTSHSTGKRIRAKEKDHLSKIEIRWAETKHFRRAAAEEDLHASHVHCFDKLPKYALA